MLPFETIKEGNKPTNTEEEIRDTYLKKCKLRQLVDKPTLAEL